jgi:hypothetical protein
MHVGRENPEVQIDTTTITISSRYASERSCRVQKIPVACTYCTISEQVAILRLLVPREAFAFLAPKKK